MYANKYANLPDIDTAPDIYETEDALPSAQINKGDLSEEEVSLPARSTRGRDDESAAGKEELDSSHLIGTEEASKKFRKAERRHDRQKTRYTYHPSPTSPSSPSSSKQPTLPNRLKLLQAEITALETELEDPSNPLLAKETAQDHVDLGELIRGVVEVKSRLNRIRKDKEGRGRLVSVILGEEDVTGASLPGGPEAMKRPEPRVRGKEKEGAAVLDLKNIAELDRRVGELENVVGSSTTGVDETSSLPPPLLPLITRLNNQLQILTQPRHIDSISRRLKLLISDIDRASAAQNQSNRRPNSNSAQQTQPQAPASSPLQEQLFPMLKRIEPSLPHIPHILTRLRTLSALHTSAGEFQRTLEGLEEEQRRMRQALEELQGAVNTVEKSLTENREVVGKNMQGLERRIEALLGGMEKLSR